MLFTDALATVRFWYVTVNNVEFWAGVKLKEPFVELTSVELMVVTNDELINAFVAATICTTTGV